MKLDLFVFVLECVDNFGCCEYVEVVEDIDVIGVVMRGVLSVCIPWCLTKERNFLGCSNKNVPRSNAG